MLTEFFVRWFRFSAGDVTARSRDAIGAPAKVTVYGVDGSIVFNGEE